ncbi:MAG: RHS repeat-associated core domain-containing protein [Oceanicaulis sp.]|nr:RHS repeat-associated core domain-containing protein [Oceanicaulis sp.]
MEIERGQLRGDTIGQRYDPETGLQSCRARYYSADLGRFVSVDPIGKADQWNLHAYVHADPLSSSDPTGISSRCRPVYSRPIASWEQNQNRCRVTSEDINQRLDPGWGASRTHDPFSDTAEHVAFESMMMVPGVRAAHMGGAPATSLLETYQPALNLVQQRFQSHRDLLRTVMWRVLRSMIIPICLRLTWC